MLVRKWTLIVDEGWEQEILKNYEYVQEDEVFQMLDETQVEVCDDCQIFISNDNEIIMDVFACPDNRGYCLNCCGCEDHKEEKWY